jgi:hypothetical protein
MTFGALQRSKFTLRDAAQEPVASIVEGPLLRANGWKTRNSEPCPFDELRAGSEQRRRGGTQNTTAREMA